MIDPSLDPGVPLIVLAPEPRPDWALFLDLDGTLIDIAATPASVVVPPDLVRALQRATAALGGALAIVSGRPLADLDALLAPFEFAGGAEHGAVVRKANGSVETLGTAVPGDWVAALRVTAADRTGVLIEEKSHSVVAHYRQAPADGPMLLAAAERLVAQAPELFEVLRGNMAIEIRPRAANKARPVEVLMASPPFQGRVPIFVGDDLTDEDGFRAVEALGGAALRVGHAFLGRPLEVRRWLTRVGDLVRERER